MVQGIKTIMDFSFELERGQNTSPSVNARGDTPLSVLHGLLSSLALKIEPYTLSKGPEVSVKDYRTKPWQRMAQSLSNFP